MRKKTHADIEQIFLLLGFKLLCQYSNPNERLEIICRDGHRLSISWNSFRKTNQCTECSRGLRKNEQERIVRKCFADAGYKLLAERYERNLTRMNCICPEGHQIKMDWASFDQGTRCGECAKATRGNKKKHNVAIKATAAFEAEGYQLLDDYIDSHTPMNFVCPNGHQHQISWTNFDSGYRCTYCSKTAPVSQDRVQQSFEAEGYKLLDQYKNAHRRLRFICPQGHKWSISWGNWNMGNRCALCSGKVTTRKQVKDTFEREGYTLLTHYQNKNDQKLDFVCTVGHRHSITWADFNSGCRCIFCSSRAPVDSEFVKEFFLANSYTPITDYTNATTKISCVCPKGHQYSVIWNDFKKGNRCARCQGMIVSHEDVESAFIAEGYQLLDVYKNNSTHMRYICPEGHQHSIVWSSFQRGNRCAYCAGQKPSQEQREINEIKNGIRGLILIYLRKQNVKKTSSSSSFAKTVAEKIHSLLGNRPEGCHLDHIIPQSFFNFRNQDEIEACWDIDNLRWLSAFDNCSKGARLTDEDVKGFSESQLRLLAKASRKPKKFALLATDIQCDSSLFTNTPKPVQLSFNFC